MKRAIVTGKRGFLGRHLMRALEARGYEIDDSSSLNAKDIRDVKDHILCYRPDVVFHLAARCGGIDANRRRPGEFFYDNMLMGMSVLEGARSVEPLDPYYLRNGGPYRAPKIVMVGTVCSYPKHARVPFQEDDLWSGYPEETNAPYGVAKKALLVMAQAYRKQYGMNIVTLLPANLYGPGDNFDLNDSHVIPAMIRKYEDARREGRAETTLWGDGSATREFLYVDDCAEALIQAAEHYDDGEPINLGTGAELSMRQLSNAIARAVGYDGETWWDMQHPNGQPRRALDTTRAQFKLGWKASTPLATGLTKTITWYREHWAAIAAGERP